MHEDPKLESVFAHIGSLHDQLKALQNSKNYIPFQEIREGEYNFSDAEKGLKDEIKQYTKLIPKPS